MDKIQINYKTDKTRKYLSLLTWMKSCLQNFPLKSIKIDDKTSAFKSPLFVPMFQDFNGKKISFHEYGKLTDRGWQISHIKSNAKNLKAMKVNSLKNLTAEHWDFNIKHGKDPIKMKQKKMCYISEFFLKNYDYSSECNLKKIITVEEFHADFYSSIAKELKNYFDGEIIVNDTFFSFEFHRIFDNNTWIIDFTTISSQIDEKHDATYEGSIDVDFDSEISSKLSQEEIEPEFLVILPHPIGEKYSFFIDIKGIKIPFKSCKFSEIISITSSDNEKKYKNLYVYVNLNTITVKIFCSYKLKDYQYSFSNYMRKLYTKKELEYLGFEI